MLRLERPCPATNLENRVLGDTADEVKREAKQAAADQFDKAKDKAKDVAHQLVEDNVNVPGNGSERAGGAPKSSDHFG